MNLRLSTQVAPGALVPCAERAAVLRRKQLCWEGDFCSEEVQRLEMEAE